MEWNIKPYHMLLRKSKLYIICSQEATDFFKYTGRVVKHQNRAIIKEYTAVSYSQIKWQSCFEARQTQGLFEVRQLEILQSTTKILKVIQGIKIWALIEWIKCEIKTLWLRTRFISYTVHSFSVNKMQAVRNRCSTYSKQQQQNSLDLHGSHLLLLHQSELHFYLFIFWYISFKLKKKAFISPPETSGDSPQVKHISERGIFIHQKASGPKTITQIKHPVICTQAAEFVHIPLYTYTLPLTSSMPQFTHPRQKTHHSTG